MVPLGFPQCSPSTRYPPFSEAAVAIEAVVPDVEHQDLRRDHRDHLLLLEPGGVEMTR